MGATARTMADIVADGGASALTKRPHDPTDDGPEASEADRYSPPLPLVGE